MNESLSGSEQYYLPDTGEEPLDAGDYTEAFDVPITPDETAYDQDTPGGFDDKIVSEEIADYLAECPPTLSEAVGRADTATEALYGMWPPLVTILKTNPNVHDNINQVVRAQREELGRVVNQSDKATAYVDAIKADPDAYSMPGMEALILQLREQISVAASAELVAHGIAMAEYYDTQEQVVASVDWGDAVSEYLTGQSNDWEDIIRNLQPTNVSKKTYRGVVEIIDGLRAKLSDGAPTSEALSTFSYEGDNSHEDVVEAATWFGRMAKVYHIMSFSRHKALSDDLDVDSGRGRLDRLSRALSTGYDTGNTSSLPPAIGLAFRKKAQELQERFCEKDAAWCANYLENAPVMKVSGEEAVRRVHGGTVDPFLFSLKIFREDSHVPVTYHETDPQQRERIGGWYDHGHTGGDNVSVHLILGTAEKPVSWMYLQKVADHEKAHYDQANRHSFESLFEWVTIVENDPAGLPKRLESVLELTKPGWNLDTEDYAYSVNDYYDRPDELLERSSARFNYINNKYKLYSLDEETR